MRFLLTPVGSGGDLHPFIGLGRELKARGHDVFLFSAEPHRAMTERAGLTFVGTTGSEEYQAATLNPDLWHPQRGFKTVLKMIIPSLASSLDRLAEHYVRGATMLVGHPLSFYTRIFEDATPGPAASLHLAPSSLRTVYQVPALPPGLDISGFPTWLKRSFWAMVDKLAIDPLIAPGLNRIRASHGLPPVRRIFQEWINSPRLVIGMFPEWFAPRQPDWPPAFRHASFPLWDDPGPSMDAGLNAFLDRGPPPIVVTPGTANRHATRFFATAATALSRLGRRGIFLTGYPEQVPAGLPDSIAVRQYVPFSVVLPRAAAFMHHGGIGTLAQGMASGTPQLIMPMAFDQPDNALRASRLGVARWLSPRKFTTDGVTTALRDLLESSAVATATATCRDRLARANGVAITCDLLEQESRRTTNHSLVYSPPDPTQP